MSRLHRPLLSLVAALLAGAGASLLPTAAGATNSGDAYVALGDSYTSGPGINLDFQTTHVPIDCGQSKYSYPYLVNTAIGAEVFRNPSCGGATTEHFANPQSLPLGGTNAPQYNRLGQDTTLVTVGIGGNDIGLVGLATGCINLLLVPIGPPPFGQPCKDIHTAGGIDQYSQRIAATAPKIDAALDEIHARAPQATIFVVGYPAVLPESGHCWPYVPILEVDVTYIREKVKEANAMLAAESAENGATYVDTWTSSIGHDACAPIGTNWVTGLVPLPPAFPLHPTADGMANTASVVTAAINASGWTP